MTQKIEQIMWMKPDELIPYEMNAKMHPASQVEHIANSIKAFGWTQPIVVDENNVVVIGHGRLMAAKELHLEKVPVVRRDDLTEKQINACRLADNKTNESEWDFAKLEQELADLDIAGIDMSDFGFEVGEDFEDHNREIVEDEVPEVQEEAVSKLGQIYQLGRHRLMCGDSTNIEDVKKLMNKEEADMVFTDPPYNVNYSGRGEINELGHIKNDNMDDNNFDLFCHDLFENYNKVLKPMSGIYVCHPDAVSAPKISFEKNFAMFFTKSSTIIWVKQSGGIGWQDYRGQHEPILYGWKEGKGEGRHKFYGDRTNTTVWEINMDNASNYVHPTQKPVALPAKAIKNSSREGDLVLDLFGGSGSTLIASEQLNRKCCMMELDPHYVDVIIKRWENLTGEKAVLLSE